MHSKIRFDSGLVKFKFKLGLVLVMAAAAIALSAWPASAVVGTPKYPDLRMLPPTDLSLGMTLKDGEAHYIVRFATTTVNVGNGPLELHGSPHVPHDGLFDATQWVYEDPAGVATYPVGVFQYHEAHSHFHFNDFARYEVWTRARFDRAQAHSFRKGSPLYTSSKVSFCIYDNWRHDPMAGRSLYGTCTPLMEGLSPGWGDVYGSGLADQWVDVGQRALPDGDYVVRQIVDPTNRIYESDGKSDQGRESEVANQAYTYFSIAGGQLVEGS